LIPEVPTLNNRMVDPIVASLQTVLLITTDQGLPGLQQALQKFAPEYDKYPKNITKYDNSFILISEEDVPFQKVSHLPSYIKADIDNLKRFDLFLNIIEMNKTALSDYPAYK
jgi:hypothetical protein